MSTAARFTGAANTENTYVGFERDFQSIPYAASIALSVKRNKAFTLIQIGNLTGALSLTVNVGDAGDPPFVGDTLGILLSNQTGGALVATFSTGFATSGTASIASTKFGYVEFVFNGTAWQEVCRALTA